VFAGGENGFEVSVCLLPFSGVFEKDAFAGPGVAWSLIRDSRRLLALLQGKQPFQKLLRGHTRQKIRCQDWNESALHHVVERFN
jgi:hypothetical protein